MGRIESRVLDKLIRMFRPHEGDFLDHPANEVVSGPNDRSLMGFDTNFPKEWLVEDFDFTAEEADWFVGEVRKRAASLDTPTMKGE